MADHSSPAPETVDMMAAPTGAGFVRIDSVMGSHRCAFETVAACETRPTVRYDDKSNTHYVEYLIMMYPGDGAAPFEIAQRYSTVLSLHARIRGEDPGMKPARRLAHKLLRWAMTPATKYDKIAACLDGPLPCLLQNKLAGEVVLRRAQRLCVYFARLYDCPETKNHPIVRAFFQHARYVHAAKVARLAAGLGVLDVGKPRGPPLPNKEDPDALVQELKQQVPEIMAQARAFRLMRRRERDAYEAQYGPTRDEAAMAAEEAAVAREEAEEREALCRTPPPPDEEWAVAVEGVELVIPTSRWQRSHHLYRLRLLHRPTGREFRVEKRFSDFVSLHGQLSKERIAIYDKYLKHCAPRKPRPWEERTQPRLSREVLQERRERLRGYLWALANSDFRGNDVLVQFLGQKIE